MKCATGKDTAIVDRFPIDFKTPFGQLQLDDCELIVQPQPK